MESHLTQRKNTVSKESLVKGPTLPFAGRFLYQFWISKYNEQNIHNGLPRHSWENINYKGCMLMAWHEIGILEIEDCILLNCDWPTAILHVNDIKRYQAVPTLYQVHKEDW